MIDSHAHLDDEDFDVDREEVIKGLEAAGIDLVVNIAADLPSSEASVALAKKYERIYATVGVHPHEAKTYNDEVEKRLKELAKEEKVVALGEIGLDFHYDFSPRDVQRRIFKRQLVLAHELGLPIVIHSREADQETFDLFKSHIKAHPEDRVLIHCYSGSVELMREYTKCGAYIALGGTTTFKNARVPKEVAKEVPLTKLLLETDSPYLTPVPYRGKRNEPKYVRLVAENIASLRGIDVEELLEHTDANTREFYGL